MLGIKHKLDAVLETDGQKKAKRLRHDQQNVGALSFSKPWQYGEEDVGQSFVELQQEQQPKITGYEAAQESQDKIKQVEVYYSNDDVMILLDGLLKRVGFVRVRSGLKQDLVEHRLTCTSTRVMVLAPIAENSEEAVIQLGRDISRAHSSNIEQVLVPINIPNIHWYTLQLQLIPVLGGYAVVASVHDSLGMRKNSIVVKKLIAQGVPVTKQMEGKLPKVQLGESGARNLYCGGYTARLIADLALNNGMITDRAWIYPDIEASALRREDVDIVNAYNSANAKSFGKKSIDIAIIIQAAENMSLIRNFIAKKKELKLFQELNKVYLDLGPETKELIKSVLVPSDPAGIYALVRNLYTNMPSVLKVLFQVNILGEIEKDEEGLLKLDANLEVEQIRKIILELQRICLKLAKIESVGAQRSCSHNMGAVHEEDVKQPLHNGNYLGAIALFNNLGIKYYSLGCVKEAINYWEHALAVKQALYQDDHPDIAKSLNDIGTAYEKLGDVRKALNYWERGLVMRQTLYQGNHPDKVISLNNLGIACMKLGYVNKALDYMKYALVMGQALYAHSHSDVAVSLNNIGVAYGKLGDIRNSLDYRTRALIMRQALCKGNHPDLTTPLDSVGIAYKNLGDISKGLDYQKQALNIRLDAFLKLYKQNQEKNEELKGEGTVSHTINNYPEYYSSGIDQILKLRISSLNLGFASKLCLLKSLYSTKQLSSTTRHLVKAVDDMFLGDNARLILVPFNVYNKHWLGLLFKTKGTLMEVIHMDSEQETMSVTLKEELKTSLSIYGYRSAFSEIRLEKQRYSNCGPEAIENFVYYLTGTRATQEGAMYVHSLLVENSLLDPKGYRLKIEENKKLIAFLSNANPIGIMELALRPEQVFEERLAIIDLNKEKKLEGNVINSLLHRASIWFKTLDLVIDSARLAQEPTMAQAKKLALDYAHLQGMISGVNVYSVMIGGAEAMYQLQLGEYRVAFSVAAGTVSATVLPVILAMANRPYLGIAYGAWIATSTAYGAITNAYSFALEFSDKDAALRSAMAYKDLAVVLAASPLQAVYDFEPKAKEYKLHINDILFEREKYMLQAQVKGDFEQKVFDYIYLPELIEKYALMSDVIRGILTEEEAQALQANHITITSKQQSYEHCMKLRIEGSKSSSEYYCYNLSDQVLDHVELTAKGGIAIIEHL